MCCFTGPVKFVSKTHIFARSSTQGRQFIVYSMTVESPTEVAMILPLPSPSNAPENAVRFISLDNCPKFFEEMMRGFPPMIDYSLIKTQGLSDGAPLEVHEVGSFEASFVPTERDFHRLDARFRLPASTWAQLPLYHDYGFAVFKLKAGARLIHPMAFEFPRRDPRHLFFPTVHIHDGKVHKMADFDHHLFCQKAATDHFPVKSWTETAQTAGQFMKTEHTAGIVTPDAHCYYQQIYGERANADIYL